MVGDGEKLLTDSGGTRRKVRPNEPDSLPEKTRPLASIFLYTWVTSLVSDYRRLLAHLKGDLFGWTDEAIVQFAQSLWIRIASSLPEDFGADREIHKVAENIVTGLRSHKKSLAQRLCDQMLSKHLASLKKDMSSVWRSIMAKADVIFCTLATAGGMMFRLTLPVDDLIVDEAAAATEPELYIPFHLKPKRLLAVGDPKQLPATVLSQRATELGLNRSLHHRLMYDCSMEHIMLDVQYRMNPAISSFPSECFYGSKIGNGENVTEGKYATGEGACLLDSSSPYVFMEVKGVEEATGEGGSHRNPAEAKAVVDLVLQLQHLKQHYYSEPDDWCTQDRIRIITFYQAQVSMIQSMLQKHLLRDKVVVATVDSSQGCEADIVIVSFVRSPLEHSDRKFSKRDAGFLTDDRRMNVALTRAKYQLICVGNLTALQQMEGADTLQRLANNAVSRGAVIPYTGFSASGPLDRCFKKQKSKK